MVERLVESGPTLYHLHGQFRCEKNNNPELAIKTEGDVDRDQREVSHSADKLWQSLHEGSYPDPS